MNDSIIDRAVCFIRELFKNNCDGHDAEHSIRVYRNALLIAKDEPECNRQIIALAALLHDADDSKLFNTENNANARLFLKQNGVNQDEVEQICLIINSVSFSKNRGKIPPSIEAKIVQDADRLDAIGAVGIARTFAFGGRIGRTLDLSIQHFHDKLLLLKNEMNTAAAKEIAESRHSFMEEFLAEFDKETSV
ncbi:MAG: HD domain-containing protein [Oscillospiraceae bacterium]|nr:HD domain-containing protein [Oscillospiraceae bacterium]